MENCAPNMEQWIFFFSDNIKGSELDEIFCCQLQILHKIFAWNTAHHYSGPEHRPNHIVVASLSTEEPH